MFAFLSCAAHTCPLHATRQNAKTFDASNALKTQLLRQIHPMGGRNVPDISECPRYFGVLPGYRLQASESGLVWRDMFHTNGPGSGLRLLARAVVDKLIGRNHRRQRTPASTHLLIQRVRVKRAWCDVAPGLAYLKIFVAQLTHGVELVAQERKCIFVSSGVCSERSESESLLCLSAVRCEPVFC